MDRRGDKWDDHDSHHEVESHSSDIDDKIAFDNYDIHNHGGMQNLIIIKAKDKCESEDEHSDHDDHGCGCGGHDQGRGGFGGRYG